MYIESLKFSLWADFIERDYLDAEFKELIAQGVINGATSNPAIFKNAILNSSAYKTQLATLDGLSPKEKYEAVAIYDITKAADILRPLFDSGDDGYVSIEVDPFLCDDAEGTIEEGRRLYKMINRPNVMIKVPATEAGYIAMEKLTSEGIAVNATLIFKESQAKACAEAFAKGVAIFGKNVDTVISVFVSRVDRAIDTKLLQAGVSVGLTGIYNSAAIYNSIEKMGVNGCRTLFASTGVKDDSLSADYYIKGLLAYNSVNTAPIDTIKAYMQSEDKSAKLPLEDTVIQEHFEKVKNAGVDLNAVLDEQIADGLIAFKDAFRDILEAL
ncbi:MAG: transaldolase [Campylobacterales bacterium]|nr:transaldolase [Campylobacterales bacterium]